MMLPSEIPDIGDWAILDDEDEDNDLRTEVTVITENGKVYEVTTFYKDITKTVPRAVAERKKWKKFGAAEKHGPGPDVSTTFAAEEVPLQFIQTQLEQELLEEKKEALREDKAAMWCRHCQTNDHWSRNCPNKELNEEKAETKETKESVPVRSSNVYVPPNARVDESTGKSKGVEKSREKENGCHVSNLPEDCDEGDVLELLSHYGPLKDYHFVRDKKTRRFRGFAYFYFETYESAKRAIEELNNKHFQYSIIKVEWANSPAKQATNDVHKK